jgi:succinate dehydrogenase/fumarate reductase cytochrome b subunit
LGILLVVLLGMHLLANHWFAPQGLLEYEGVIRYLDLPGIAWMEFIFLVVVTIHCLLGIHSILLDLNFALSINKSLTWILVVIGALTILYGFRLTWVVAAMGGR